MKTYAPAVVRCKLTLEGGEQIVMDDFHTVITIEPDSLPFTQWCPHCKGLHDIGEIYEGSSERCASCGALLQLACNDQYAWLFVEKRPPVAPRTGRQRTRSSWAKKGRR